MRKTLLATSLLVLTLAVGCESPPRPADAPSNAIAPPSTPDEPVPPAGPKGAALLDPTLATEQAPDTFKAKFWSSKGMFTIEVHRAWAPLGADRFYNLVKIGFFDDERFFRVVSDFMCQFGVNGDPAVNAKWKDANITDDAPTQSNTRGFVTFATSGKDSRSDQVFISYKDNSGLDAQGFAPFGTVVEGMSVVDALYSGYGDGPPDGKGPDQQRLQNEGNDYLKSSFAELDWIKAARIAK